jgi:histidinol phosphatase-like PHP family hydrolase
MIDLHIHSLFSDGELVARLAKDCGVILGLNSDAHFPHDFMTRQFAHTLAQGTGLGGNALAEMLGNSRDLIEKIT